MCGKWLITFGQMGQLRLLQQAPDEPLGYRHKFNMSDYKPLIRSISLVTTERLTRGD
jgi:hypothetical protein